MIPPPRFVTGIRDSYVSTQIFELSDHIDELYAIVDKLDTKQLRIQGTCKKLSELFKETDTETLAQLTRQDEEIQNIKLYLFNLHTFLIKNIKGKTDDIEELTLLLEKLSIQ